MSRKRRNHSPEFKAKVALAAIKGDLTLSELARRFEVNANLVVRWKKQLLENSAEVFASGNGLAPDREAEIKDLQAMKIAALYKQTISTLSPRIVVNGRPQYLQVDRTVNWIRTLLFAGLRSAVLWRQMGGGRFSLMFGRKKMLEEAQSLLPG